MKPIAYAIAGAFVIGAAIYFAGGGEHWSPSPPTARSVLASYRSADNLFAGTADGEFHVVAAEARWRAADDLDYARAQRALARETVERLLSEIAIDGAANVDIGGEIRAARMAEAEWQRAVEEVTAYIARLDFEIAGNVDLRR